jgi:YVTN family beta-propeller protein
MACRDLISKAARGTRAGLSGGVWRHKARNRCLLSVVTVVGLMALTGAMTVLSPAAYADSVTATITVGTNPTGVALNPAGTLAYVTNYSDATVSVINTSTGAVTATINVGTGPFGVAVNSAGTFAYVTNNSVNTVSVIDTATNTVTATVNVGSAPAEVALNPSGAVAYVTNGSAGTVSAINTSTNTVTATTTVGSHPDGIAVNPAGTFAYVANGGAGTVSVIDTSTNTVTATVIVGSGPDAVALNPTGTIAYVANSGAGTVSEIDLATNTATSTVTVGANPHGIAINPAGTAAYITDTGVFGISNQGTTVSVISIPQVPAPGTQAAPSAVAGNAAATVTVVAPGSGGTPTSYTVTAHDSTTPGNGGQTCTVTGASGSCTVTGLTNGDSYTFTSTAADAGGTSTASPASNAVIPQVGLAPRLIADSPPRATLDAPYSYTFTASGSPAPTFRVAAGRLPADLALNPVTGVLSGTPKGSGVFTFSVTATNWVGSVTSGVIEITVLAETVRVPSAPRHLRARPNDGRVTLTFIAPASDGGAKVDHYQVSVDGGRWQTGLVRHQNPLTAVITDLADGHTYTLRVRAENSAGVSATSTVTATPKTWVTDPITAALRKAEVPVPADPAAYRGPRELTRATDRSHNGTIAVPLTSVHGRPLHPGQAAVLSGDGLFDFNQATLTAAGARQIEDVVASLTGSRTVTCEGYTDYGGVAAHQLALSIARAKTVCRALVADGAHVATHTVGYGATRPVVIGGTIAQRAGNRRVVIFINN